MGPLDMQSLLENQKKYFEDEIKKMEQNFQKRSKELEDNFSSLVKSLEYSQEEIEDMKKELKKKNEQIEDSMEKLTVIQQENEILKRKISDVDRWLDYQDDQAKFDLKYYNKTLTTHDYSCVCVCV